MSGPKRGKPKDPTIAVLDCPRPLHAGSKVKANGTRKTSKGLRQVYVCKPVGEARHDGVATHTGALHRWQARAGDDVMAQRAILDDGLSGVLVRRGGTGRRTREQMLERLEFQWIGPVGPERTPDETWVDGAA